MGVILTKHLTDYAGAFLVWLGTHIVDTHHTEQDATVNGLKSVSHIRQGTSHNHRH